VAEFPVMLAKRSLVRVLRWAGVAIAAALAAIVLVAGILVATNPDPRAAPGWERLAEMPQARGEVASTTARLAGSGSLVVAGGFTGLTASTSAAVHAFEPGERRWRRLPDLPQARHHAGAAAVGGDIYVGGGAASATDRAARDNLWVLREGATGWEHRAAMPEGREGHRLRALGGRLYAVGGRGASADVLVYDPQGDTWSRGPALPDGPHHLGVVVREGRLWALGGRTEEDDSVLDAVHSWKPGDERWREEPRLPRPVSAAVEAVVGGTIHLVGGEDPAPFGGGTIDSHLTLGPGAGAWQEEQPAPLAVHGAAGGALEGRVVVAGGSARQGLLSPLAWTDLVASYEPGPRGGG
jgi:hypothetical protein